MPTINYKIKIVFKYYFIYISNIHSFIIINNKNLNNIFNNKSNLFY